MTDNAAFERILNRERKARKEAEKIMEKKSLELLKANERLFTLNGNLEKEIAERTEEIKKNADQLNLLFNENPFPVMVYDKKTLRILDVNNTAIEKYQYSKRKFLKKTVHELHPIDEVIKLEEYCTNLNSQSPESSSSSSSSWQHLSADGKLFDVRVTANSILYNGVPCRIAIIEDVTEKNRLLREKDLQKKKYQDFIENSSDIIYRINAKGRFIYINPAGAKASGYSEKEILRMNFIDLISPNYKKQVSSFYEFQMKQKLESTYTEFPVLGKNGKEYWIGQNVEASELSQGGQIVYNATARNITERKKLERAILRSEEKFRSIIENMELGLLEVDRDGIITKAYPKFCLLTGYSHKELEGIKGDFLLDAKGLAIMKEQTDSRNTGITNVYELQLTRKDGTKIWVLISAAPFYDEYNRMKGSVGIHLDITERVSFFKRCIKTTITIEDYARTKNEFQVTQLTPPPPLKIPPFIIRLGAAPQIR